MPDTDDLREARDAVERAAKTTADDDLKTTLSSVADAFGSIAAGDAAADHAVFDGHLNELRQARKDAGRDTTNELDRALEYAEAYREGLEQA